jgi:hypothetical protein
LDNHNLLSFKQGKRLSLLSFKMHNLPITKLELIMVQQSIANMIIKPNQ